MLTNFTFDYTKDQLEKIGQLRNLIEADNQLEVGTEDVLLSKFLYYTHWQIDKAHENIRSYYDFKNRHPDWVAQGSVEDFRELFFFTKSKFVMPQPDREGRAVLVFKVVDAFDRYPNYLHKVIALDDFIFESLLLLPQVQKCGLTIIYDLTCATKNIVRLFSPSMARTLNEKDKALPFSSRRIHYIQKGILMNTALSIFMGCLNKRLKEEIFSHDVKSLGKLREMIGDEAMPAAFGGPPENILDLNLLFEFMLQNESYLMKMQSYHKKTGKI